jgi:hypothetical protein
MSMITTAIPATAIPVKFAKAFISSWRRRRQELILLFSFFNGIAVGRYTHRVAISNNRILKIENGAVNFKWRDYRDKSSWKIMTLDAEEFIRRFMMHVLPSGFTKIRHYGFLSSRGKQEKLRSCKIQTGTSLRRKEKLSAEQLIQKLIGRKPSQCPQCGFSGLLKTGLAPPV